MNETTFVPIGISDIGLRSTRVLQALLSAADLRRGGLLAVTLHFGELGSRLLHSAPEVRKGLRGSVLTNSALYRLRLMASYATGLMDNGWAFAANVSARLGGNDWIDGVYYRSFAYYLSADKIFNDTHKLSFAIFGTPGERGAQNSSTQEVYDLMGDNMYNSNWGYLNGKVRNTRVRKTHEPIAFLKWDFTPSDKFESHTTLLFRFGSNGYTAMDWYNAQDPRPDYYRNLPSYLYNPDPDYKRNNLDKATEAFQAWKAHDPSTVHFNWDRIYQVNQMSEGGRSKYVQEERRAVDSEESSVPGHEAAASVYAFHFGRDLLHAAPGGRDGHDIRVAGLARRVEFPGR